MRKTKRVYKILQGLYLDQDNIKFVFVDEISLDDFRLFIESLTTERETWSLDMELYDREMCEGKDNIETWYNVQSRYNKMIAINEIKGPKRRVIQQTIFVKRDGFYGRKEVIGFVSGKSLNTGVCTTCGVSNPEVVEISYVVKKEHQGNGIGTHFLSLIENYISEKNFNIMTANYFEDNIASDRAFSKAGWDRIDKIGDKVVVRKNIEKGN